MRTREKLTLEEKFALALALIKRDRTLDAIRVQYRVSHTTAYKIRNAFLEGGRAALGGDRRPTATIDLEARVRAIEARLEETAGADWGLGRGNGAATPRPSGDGTRVRGRGPASGNGAGR